MKREVIQKAIEGGYDKYNEKEGWGNGNNVECVYDMILDPLFWQCLAKQQGWSESNNYWSNLTSDGYNIKQLDRWENEWHNFIEHISNGGTPDSFFQTIIK